MIEIIVRGSGSSGNQTVIRETKSRKCLVIDAGIKPKQSDIKNAVAVCMTHCHSDHSSYLKPFKGVPILSTREELMDNRVMKQYDLITSIPKFVYAELNQTYEFSPFKVTVLHAQHDTKNPVHFFIQCGNQSVFYGCDTPHLQEELDEYFKKADVIMIDCNYDVRLMKRDDTYSIALKDRIVRKGHSSTQYIKQRMYRYQNKLVLMHLSSVYNAIEYVKDKLPDSLAVVSREMCPYKVSMRKDENRLRTKVSKNRPPLRRAARQDSGTRKVPVQRKQRMDKSPVHHRSADRRNTKKSD